MRSDAVQGAKMRRSSLAARLHRLWPRMLGLALGLSTAALLLSFAAVTGSASTSPDLESIRVLL